MKIWLETATEPGKLNDLEDMRDHWAGVRFLCECGCKTAIDAAIVRDLVYGFVVKDNESSHR